MREIAPAGRLRAGRSAALCLVIVFLAACGGAAGAGDSGGGGGGGGADDAAIQQIIDDAQTTIGTSMISGTFADNVITITVVDNFGTGGAQIFMCAQIAKSLKANDPSGAITAVMVEQSGTKLISSTDCH